MGDDGARGGEQGLFAVVTAARRRLARIAGREHLRRHGWWVLGAGAAAAACRPIAWRLAAEAPPWLGLGRAFGLFAAGSAVAVVALLVAGRRRGPSEVAAARAIDGALGSAEVIASGLAFARDGREEPVVLLARRRAAALAEKVKPAELFALPSLKPSRRASALFALGAVMAIGVGGYNPALATALLTPPTASENAAAAELEDAAADVAEQAQKDAKNPAPEKPQTKREKGDEKLAGAGPALADKAKEAARAARRGDRRGALEKLEELRSAGQQKAARAGDLGATLRKVAEALAPSSSEKQGAGGSGKDAASASAGKDASEEMRLLADKMKSPEGSGSSGEKGAERAERVLERLERAAEEARRSASEGKSQEAADAARALSKAAASLKRGEREAAAQALQQAAERAAAMEQQRAAAAAEAMAIAEMLEKSGALERAIQAALLGKGGEGSGENGEPMALAGAGENGGKDGSGKEGNGGGKDGTGSGKEGTGIGKSGSGGKQGATAALRSAILSRLAAMGMADPPQDDGSNGTGPHVPDRHRQKRAPLIAQGSIRAPSQVGEGPRAIQAINGLGKGTEPPKEYREVFPSYDAAAEEGLADERIPAQRRAAVRRYFQAIRPDQQQ
jgi:hypothetical protein